MKTVVCSDNTVGGLMAAVDCACESGLQPTLAVVFASVAQDFRTLAQALGARGMMVAGVTTAGEIANLDVLDESAAVMLMEADPAAVHTVLVPVAEGESLFEAGQRLGAAACDRFASPVVVAFASGVHADGEAVVRGVRASAGPAVPLFGGMAGDDLLMRDTYVFSADAALAHGIAGIIFDGSRFAVEGMAANGWRAVGIAQTVTRADGNIVYTIADQPAYDVFRDYLSVPDDMQRGGALTLGVHYPLSVMRENGTAVIRAPIGRGPEPGSLIFAGTVPQGAKVKFCIPPSVEIVDRVVDEARELREQLPQADAIIVVSCKARQLALGPFAHDEVRELQQVWGAPAAGFFSYGEIGGRVPQLCDFHTETCTVVALRQRDA